MSSHEQFMRRCIELAREAEKSKDTLVGSLVVLDGSIIGEGVEAVKAKTDLTAHAEIEAIKAACATLKTTNLTACVLYTTAEPCFMCSYAIRQARISRVVIGRPAPGIGGVTSKHPILTDLSIKNWTPPPEVIMGILQGECEELLRKPSKVKIHHV
jgi:tRNA(adenine34) deaminase